MINQKQLSKTYKHLNGSQATAYVGRIPSNIKSIMYGISHVPKTNEYGDYKKITIVITKTNFNGNILTIYPQLPPGYWGCELLKIKLENIPKFIVH